MAGRPEASSCFFFGTRINAGMQSNRSRDTLAPFGAKYRVLALDFVDAKGLDTLWIVLQS